ncbi:MAG: hypothetical protein K8S18_18980 [Desulfobacula sp.]|nr:hypothetical protein [Desulfobacula sp.]
MKREKRLVFAIIICSLIILIFNTSQAGQKPITVEEHKKITISLYKEIRDIKNRGLLYNDCGFGGCAHPEVKAWKKKLDKHRDTKCSDGIPVLPIPYNDAALLGDMWDLVINTYKEAGILARYKFELAMICFENPEICKKYLEPELTDEELEELLKTDD